MTKKYLKEVHLIYVFNIGGKIYPRKVSTHTQYNKLNKT